MSAPTAEQTGGAVDSRADLRELRHPGPLAELVAAAPVEHLLVPDLPDDLDAAARWQQRFPLQPLAHAQDHYADHGYLPVAVPWVVSDAAYGATAPRGVRQYTTLGGNLVASAEQGFIQQLLDGTAPEHPAQAFSPCFRDEAHDRTHLPYFVKVELFDPDTTDAALGRMLTAAVDFFTAYLPVRAELTATGVDVVAAPTGVRGGLELGSYGRRVAHRADGTTVAWTYGTGVALPRLTQALADQHHPAGPTRHRPGAREEQR